MILLSRTWELPGLSISAVSADPAQSLLTARSGISAILLRAGELVAPGAATLEEGEPPDASSVRLDGAVRRKVAKSLAAELDDMLEDAAEREVSARGAEVLLLTAEIVRWLGDGGELPGNGAIELLEVHVAVFNDARHEEEREMQRALLVVLLALVGAQTSAIRGGRWRHRRVNVEAAEERERRRFGANLDELREKRGLSIGELAAAAQLEVLRLVGLIFAAESAGSGEVRLLAVALGVEPGALIPEEMPGAAAGGAGEEPRSRRHGERDAKDERRDGLPLLRQRGPADHEGPRAGRRRRAGRGTGRCEGGLGGGGLPTRRQPRGPLRPGRAGMRGPFGGNREDGDIEVNRRRIAAGPRGCGRASSTGS